MDDSTSPAAPPAATDPPPTEAIAYRALAKSYGKVDALRGLNLSVRRGEVYGFLGRNGAGKSTAIRIAMGITQPSRGEVRVLGEPMTGRAITARQRIGYVAQEQNFYGWMTVTSIGSFVGGFFPTWSEEEYARLVAQLELPLDRKIRTFSGGMKAKLALCLALAHEPEILILDEPTAGLDAVARREFIEMVREQAERSSRTTFFSSHLIDEVEAAADRVGIIDDGRTIYEGELSALAATVRLLTAAEGHEDPELFAAPGIRVLQDRTRRGRREVVVRGAAAGAFDDAELPPNWRFGEMSLEDIFVALVAKPLTKLSHATPDVADR